MIKIPLHILASNLAFTVNTYIKRLLRQSCANALISGCGVSLLILFSASVTVTQANTGAGFEIQAQQKAKIQLTMTAPVKPQIIAKAQTQIEQSKPNQKLNPTAASLGLTEKSPQADKITASQSERIKPQKQPATSTNVQPKVIKVATMPTPLAQAPKRQQVLHAPIVVLPLASDTGDAESGSQVKPRSQVKPKKQQVLHPPVVALKQPAKPAMVLKPKVIVEQTAIKSAAVVERYQPPAKKKYFSRQPSADNAAPTMVSSALTAKSTLTAGSQTKKPKRKIYQYQQNGVTTFSNVVPTTEDFDVLLYDCFACQVDSQLDWQRIPIFVSKHKQLVEDAAKQFQLDPALIRAVIHAESAFNAKAHSKVGAIGLMQLMPATAKELGVTDAYNVRQNILGGSQYLAYLLERFDNDIELACAAYNAGPTTVTKYQGIPPYPETQAYVERVKILLKRYQAALAS
ncbi:hypothetical protein BCU91_02560 [Shewanella sp. 10N.286.52.B9]|nr:hypothetical protein BCU91_02560 [Shewanella sp. 10N.286.52.B9]